MSDNNDRNFDEMYRSALFEATSAGLDAPYDPVGGHTKEEADAEYEKLYRELHGLPESGSVPEAEKEHVFIVGHTNPDTDSICSAIAYAELKNAVDPTKKYIPGRAGHVPTETNYILNRFGINPPQYIQDVSTQISDIEFRHTKGIDTNTTLKRAWSIMEEHSILTLPVTEDVAVSENPGGGNTAKRLKGIVTVKDIGKVYMNDTSSDILAVSHTPYENVSEALGGHILYDNGSHAFTGNILIAAADPKALSWHVDEGDTVIVSNREETQHTAIEEGASCLIVTLDAPVSEAILSFAKEKECSVITTAYDTYTTARLISQSVPVGYAMKSENLVTFQNDTYLATVKDLMSKTKHRDFPVLDENGNYAGMISRRFLLDAKKKNVILVDHNEKSQALKGIEEANILEIIDHHRLGAMETIEPVYFRNQPVGSTSTIVYQIFKENGLVPSIGVAGLLCSGVISDTLLFRSPTTTQSDKLAAVELAGVAGIDLEAHASAIFKAGSTIKDADPAKLIYGDFKTYSVNELNLGIGQINSMDEEELAAARDKLIPYLPTAIKDKGLDMVFILLTDIPKSASEIIYAGENSAELLEEAFGKHANGAPIHVDGLLSRKKQMVPELLAAMQN
jgi:manganese-dependent inorganic pyrophosphatase